MKVEVNKDACIGCGACVSICDEVFEINDEGLSEAKVSTVDESLEADVRDASDACPTGAIEVE